MHEFLKPPLKDLGEDREMLVDEEYYVDEDYYSCLPSDIKELAPSTEVDLDTAGQWAKELEFIQMPELSHMMDIRAEKAPHCLSRKENKVRTVNVNYWGGTRYFHLLCPSGKSQ